MQLSGRFIVQVPEPLYRNKNYIDVVDLSKDYNFWKKVYEVESEGWYSVRSKKFLQTILDFLDDWEYISWKQYHAVMRISKQEPEPKVEIEVEKIALDKNTYYQQASLRAFARRLDSKHPDEAAALYEENSIWGGL